MIWPLSPPKEQLDSSTETPTTIDVGAALLPLRLLLYPYDLDLMTYAPINVNHNTINRFHVGVTTLLKEDDLGIVITHGPL